MIKAGLIGATGLSGIELARLLLEHPETDISVLTSQTYSQERISKIYPHLFGKLNIRLEELNPEEVVSKSDVIFLALPHGHSAELVKVAFEAGKKVIDLGADYRFDDLSVYESIYNTKHSGSELLSQAVYGLPEANREIIKKSQLIANPGCYPTGALLALLPIISSKAVEGEEIIIDSKSGVSGAGRKPEVEYLYVTCSENAGAYKVASHRHGPEIEQELKKYMGNEAGVIFTPHLLPMTRGILTTVYVKINDSFSEEEIREIYERAYENEPFVHMLEAGTWPQTKWVSGTNNCLLNICVDKKSSRLIAVSVIDNLIKGASGQAVQNMNLLFGLNEDTGLKHTAVYP